MYQRTSNAIQRARNSTGLTQEALAERSGYSSDSVRAWESGARVPSLEALNILAESLAAPWLPGVFLREQSAYLNSLIPDFRPGLPVAEAAAGYISCLLEQVDERFDRRLLRLVGLNLYVAANIGKVKFEKVVSKHLFIYMLCYLAVVVLLVIFPQIVNFLPSHM